MQLEIVPEKTYPTFTWNKKPNPNQECKPEDTPDNDVDVCRGRWLNCHNVELGVDCLVDVGVEQEYSGLGCRGNVELAH